MSLPVVSPPAVSTASRGTVAILKTPRADQRNQMTGHHVLSPDVPREFPTASTDTLYIYGTVGVSVGFNMPDLFVGQGQSTGRMFYQTTAGSNLYTDATNTAARQNGSFYIQTQNGSTTWNRFDSYGHYNNTGRLIFDSGGSPGIFAGTAGSELNRFITFLNSPNFGSAAGVKVGGLLVSDSYAIADPTQGNAVIQKTLSIGSNGTGGVGGVTSAGGAAAFNLLDRDGVNASWAMYANGGYWRLFQSGIGDLAWVDRPGSGGQLFRLQGMAGSASWTSCIGFIDSSNGPAGYLSTNLIYTTSSGWFAQQSAYGGAMWYTASTTTGAVSGIAQAYYMDGTNHTLYLALTAGNGVYALDVNGGVHASSFPSTSDARFKKDVLPLRGRSPRALGDEKDMRTPLERILSLRPVSFLWNQRFKDAGRLGPGEAANERRIIGLIADEVEEHIPEVVDYWQRSPALALGEEQDETVYKGLHYDRLGVITLAAVQELADKVDTLTARVKELEAS